MRKYLILICCFSLSFISNAQSLSEKEKASLTKIINDFIDASDWEHISPEIAFGGGPSSAFVCLLSLDSLGYVGSVTLLSDNKNQDSIFSILSRLKRATFGLWYAPGCKNKTIAVPIAYAQPRGNPTYVRDFIENGFKEGEYGNLIVIPRIVFGWAIRRRDFLNPTK
jgi:hypothetical protein